MTIESIKEAFAKSANAYKNNTAPSQSPAGDDRFLKITTEGDYRFRLLYCPTDKRDTPLIEQHYHGFYDAKTRRFSDEVISPVSPYIQGRAGFKSCPISKYISEIYKDTASNPELKELYDRIKRRTRSYAMVYVVKDPVNPENNGTVKLVKFALTVSRFINEQVYGKPGDDSSEDEVLGFEAFDTEAGRDLIVSVKPKPIGGQNVPTFTPSFSNRLTAINITTDDIDKYCETLRFDQLMVKSTPEELQAWFDKYVAPFAGDLGHTVSPIKARQDAAFDAEEDIDPPPAKKPTKTKFVAPAAVELEDDESEESEDEDFEVETPKPSKPAPAAKKAAPAKKAPVVEDDEEDDIFKDFDLPEDF